MGFVQQQKAAGQAVCRLPVAGGRGRCPQHFYCTCTCTVLYVFSQQLTADSATEQINTSNIIIPTHSLDNVSLTNYLEVVPTLLLLLDQKHYTLFFIPMQFYSCLFRTCSSFQRLILSIVRFIWPQFHRFALTMIQRSHFQSIVLEHCRVMLVGTRHQRISFEKWY